MKRFFLIFNLFLLFFGGGMETAVAAKKYRYIKREHGVRFHGDIPLSFPGFSMDVNLQGAYTYNWRGMLEFGPYFQLKGSKETTPFIDNWGAGLLVEYNFIKNRGKRKFIPALGLNIGVKGEAGLKLAVGPQFTAKYFVGKRTAFTAKVAYSFNAPFRNFMDKTQWRHNVDISMIGFSYYFDFY